MQKKKYFRVSHPFKRILSYTNEKLLSCLLNLKVLNCKINTRTFFSTFLSLPRIKNKIKTVEGSQQFILSEYLFSFLRSGFPLVKILNNYFYHKIRREV
ncbi:MAG: hypothetical protein B6D55_07485 [Candidatus Omnitrophica bacterium 4484_70.2]|nr:MAG: hypothetical protein B6D55_07485 [Candidatus Omnitrophica bacterium 4484_70.2]